MDAFQGCYKDGTNGTRDCRYFPVVYLILRILTQAAYTLTLSIFFYPLNAVFGTTAAFLVATVRPYKVDFYNSFDTFVLFSFSAAYSLVLLADVASTETFLLLTAAEAVIFILAMAPLLYIVGYVIYWFVGRRRMAAMLHKVRGMFSNEISLEDSLPHRMTHVDEYTPLRLGTAAENERRQWTDNTAYGV